MKHNTHHELPREVRHTPWGPAQHGEQIAPGIWSIGTAGHGGLHVSPERLLQMPAILSGSTPYSGGNWFEEDCDWALVCAAFPADFSPHDCFYALRTVEGMADYLGERMTKYRATELYQQLKARAALHQPEVATV